MKNINLLFFITLIIFNTASAMNSSKKTLRKTLGIRQKYKRHFVQGIQEECIDQKVISKIFPEKTISHKKLIPMFNRTKSVLGYLQNKIDYKEKKLEQKKKKIIELKKTITQHNILSCIGCSCNTCFNFSTLIILGWQAYNALSED